MYVHEIQYLMDAIKELTQMRVCERKRWKSIWGNQSKYTLKKHLWWEELVPGTSKMCKGWQQSCVMRKCPGDALGHLNPLEEVKVLWTRFNMQLFVVKIRFKVNSFIANVHCIHLKTCMWKMIWHYILMRLILYKVFPLIEQINH